LLNTALSQYDIYSEEISLFIDDLKTLFGNDKSTGLEFKDSIAKTYSFALPRILTLLEIQHNLTLFFKIS
jgi:hypothetical protein